MQDCTSGVAPCLQPSPLYSTSNIAGLCDGRDAYQDSAAVTFVIQPHEDEVCLNVGIGTHNAIAKRVHLGLQIVVRDVRGAAL